MSAGFKTQATNFSDMSIGNNTIASGGESFASGYYTVASGIHAFSQGHRTLSSGYVAVAMGDSTRALGGQSMAIGKRTLASGFTSFAGGNLSTASGNSSFALGSNANAIGHESFAFGQNAYASQDKSYAIGGNVNAQHIGAYTFGDDGFGSTTLNSSDFNQFSARFRGGYRLFTNAANTLGVSLAAGGNSWATISDSTKKENFISAPNDILEKIANMKIGTWNYKTQNKSIRHWGPMAQDFYENFGKDTFGIIGNDTTIASADIDGVMMAAIKALILENKTLQKKNEQLEAKLEEIADLLIEKNKVSGRN
jgi:hypothetical protein